MINPQMMEQQILSNLQALQNNVVQNAVGLYRQGKSNELTQVAQNACQQMGVSYDEMRKQAMARFGLNIQG